MSYTYLTNAQVAELNKSFGTSFSTAERQAFIKTVDEVIGMSVAEVPAVPNATEAVRGLVLMAASVDDVTPAADGTAVGTAFNELLAALRTAGISATPE